MDLAKKLMSILHGEQHKYPSKDNVCTLSEAIGDTQKPNCYEIKLQRISGGDCMIANPSKLLF
jgi:hypothetical protein